MQKSIYLSLLLSVAVLFQGCKKTGTGTVTTSLKDLVPANNAFESTIGLNLAGAGDHGIFKILNSEGTSPGIPGYTDNNNDTIRLSVYEGTSYEKWEVTNKGGDDFTIMNRGSGKYLEAVADGMVVVNQQTTSNAQLWNIVKIPGKAYKALSKSTGLAITSTGSGIRLMNYAGNITQLWGYNQLPDISETASSFSINDLLQTNMVVQRDKPFPVWGKTTAGITVTVKASWDKNLYTVVAAADGTWNLMIPASPANTISQTLTCSVNGPKPVKLDNILIGDVWIGSGQSNMTMPMNKQDDNFGGFHGVYNYQSEIAAADYPGIRLLAIKAIASNTPKEDLSKPGTWVVCNPTNAAAKTFSATGYYFARKVYTSLSGSVPVGIIISAVGASYCEQWASKETIAKDPITQQYYAGKHGSSQFYNGMIYPLKKLPVKGFLWYQGESNTSDNPVSNYTLLTTNLVKDWRTLFNQGSLPFYFVQLPPLGTLFADAAEYKNALFREAQANVRAVEHTGMACLMDVNEPYNIHNITKEPVGTRLALLALKNDYNLPVATEGPQFVSYSQTGNSVTVEFKNTEGLTDNGSQTPIYFYAASANDKKFIQVKNPIVSGTTVKFTTPKAGMTVDAVRYAFTDVSVTHINNNSGLPMEPFRTDNW